MRPTSRRPGPSRPSRPTRRSWSKRSRASTSIACSMGNHVQAGIAACFSIDEYDRDLIKKHEKTRPDKEDDRTRHMLAIGAQTGPVFLTYRASKEVDDVVRRVVATDAAVRFHRAGRRAPRGVAGSGRREPGNRRCVREDRRALHRRRPSPRGVGRADATLKRFCAFCGPGIALVRGTIACSRSRFPTTRCRSCRTTASSRI